MRNIQVLSTLTSIDFTTTNQINKIFKEVEPKKATGPGKIPLKIIKLSTI